jgi:hypothetical protein
MNIKHFIGTLAISLLATTGWAQTAAQPLNLNLPSGNLPSLGSAPASSSSTAAAPGNTPRQHGDTAATAAKPPQPMPGKSVTSGVPGVYYGDHSNTTNAGYAEQNTPHCDDATYNNPQVHGSVGMGVVSGSHMGTGSYTGGEVNVTRAFGSCDHPTGGISISIGGTQFNGGGGRGGRW